MNNTFDIRRFGNYFLYDLGRARSNFMLSGIICGLTPVIIFIFTNLFSFIMTREPATHMDNIYVYLAAMASLLAMIVSFPNKMYGAITEKRYGSDWLMRPASALEKWASMIIMVCVVLPLFVGGIFILSDTLLSICFSSTYGDSIISNISEFRRKFAEETDGMLKISIGGITYLKYAEYMLIFTLGAIVFKKSKVGKTILTIILISMVIGSMGGSLIAIIFENGDSFMAYMDSLDDPIKIENAVKWLNIGMNFYYLIVFTLLSGGIYYRIKTLKH